MSKKIMSISEAAGRLAGDPETSKEVEEEVRNSRLVTALMALRTRKGMSQKQVADAMGCDPSKISKMESGNDLNLRWGDVLAYVRSLGINMSLCLDDSTLPAAVRIKQCVMQIHDLLQSLVEIAKQVKGEAAITDKIHQFYGEVLLNFLLRFDSGYQDLLSVIRISDSEKPSLPAERHEAVGAERSSAHTDRGLVEAR